MALSFKSMSKKAPNGQLAGHVQDMAWTRPGHVLDIASIVSDHFWTWTPYDRTEDGQYIYALFKQHQNTLVSMKLVPMQ